MTEQEFFLKAAVEVTKELVSHHTYNNFGEQRIEAICAIATHIAIELTDRADRVWEQSHIGGTKVFNH